MLRMQALAVLIYVTPFNHHAMVNPPSTLLNLDMQPADGGDCLLEVMLTMEMKCWPYCSVKIPSQHFIPNQNHKKGTYCTCFLLKMQTMSLHHASSSHSSYLLFVSHSNLVIKLCFRFKATNSSPTSQIVWSMCYLPLHCFWCFSRVSLLIIVTNTSLDRELVLLQFALSGVMKDML